MSKKRKRYSDDFRASAVLMLEAAGYPGREGALTSVSSNTGVPLSTLRGWFTARRNPPPAELRNIKRVDFKQLLREELYGIHEEMPKARPDASYRDLAWAYGVLTDKLQLLDGKPTWRIELVGLLQDGTITIDQVKSELGDELAAELFEEAGIRA